ncbi:hypothetical protein ACFQ6C_16450 [Streptomyces sp. NPDC056454]|uniref:hypothetical protein n=1 Tax=Streptomyces sp. NPDC056454 TaxID=3345823 RepID=UPI00368C99B9
MVRRWVPTLLLGGLWWWAVLRLVLHPEQAGVVEGAVAAGGWGLSLLPVHVATVASGFSGGAEGLEKQAVGSEPRSPRVRPGRPAAAPGRLVAGFTRAWRRRRSGGGSGRS